VAGEAIENTLESFEQAVAQRADLLEFDVQLCADGELVVFHDWDLRRLGGSRLVVEASESARLRDVALRPPPEPGRLGPGARSVRPARAPANDQAPRIALLREVLAMRPAGLPLNLELKRRSADRARFAETVLAETAGCEPLLFSSFDWDLLAELRRRAPQVCLAPLASRWPGLLLEAGRNLRAWSLHAHRRIASRALVELAAEGGRPVLVYTVNEAAAARRLFALGVAGVFTDFPGRLRRELAAVS
jgi:glycerophosphoryl diester phosphodiesterase